MSDLTRVLDQYPNDMLIAALKERGYMVTFRDHVRTLGAQKRYPKDHALDSPMFQEIVRKDLGVALGYELAHSRHFDIAETERGVTMVAYRATVTFLAGRKIDPLDPEYPLYLHTEMNR